MSKLIFETLAGSRLYGVDLAESDYDYKGIFLESLEELLLKSRNVHSCKKENSEYEHFSLNYYMTLLGQGQVIPIDMLFAPKSYWTVSSIEWEFIRENKNHFISSQILPFIGYAKAQSIKYGLKGTKIKTISKAIELVKNKISFDIIVEELKSYDGISLWEETRGSTQIKYIDICGKSFGETTNYALWLGPLEALKASYGKRANEALTGIDFKAQYHTVRICSEAIELLRTGTITFPRPEADTLKKIRLGEISQESLEILIESLFKDLKENEVNTSLKTEPDKLLMYSLVHILQSEYLKEIL